MFCDTNAKYTLKTSYKSINKASHVNFHGKVKAWSNCLNSVSPRSKHWFSQVPQLTCFWKLTFMAVGDPIELRSLTSICCANYREPNSNELKTVKPARSIFVGHDWIWFIPNIRHFLEYRAEQSVSGLLHILIHPTLPPLHIMSHISHIILYHPPSHIMMIWYHISSHWNLSVPSTWYIWTFIIYIPSDNICALLLIWAH